MARDLRTMRIAAIDIGTNTILLLVAEIDPDGRLTVLAEEQESPRLGRSVDATGRLDPASTPAVTAILDGFLRTASSHSADRVVACATSAVRSASNRGDFIDKVKLSTGIGIRVISGEEESELTYLGAASGLGTGDGEPVVIDVGGGSTEICFRSPGGFNGGRALMRYSFDIGSVRITERFFRDSPPGPAQIASARGWITEEIAPVINPGFSGYVLVGVSGTPTTLAAVMLGLERYDREAIDGFRITGGKLASMSSRLLSSTPREVLAMSPVAAGREDILAAGTLVLSTVAEHFRFPFIRVSTRGLRYGMVLREWEQSG